MSCPNEVSFTAMMGGLAQTDRFDEALEMFVKMHRQAGYGLQGQVEKALEMVVLMGCHGLEPDEVTYVNALSACVKSGDLETGRQMFVKLSNPSITSWNAIVSGYSQHGNYGEAINLFREMQFLNARPDRTTIASILSSCTGMGLIEYGKQVHAFSVKENLHDDIFVSSGLVDMYSKCDARKWYDPHSILLC
ncbi:hypothetical protein MKX01_007335 [Papaver californicum]|nr:hypothetical protein MKX01_007335 [Papaver californicum]